MLNDYALIIGVESYRAFDPGGDSDVPGALNDARALVHECLAMGFSPERIRVLSSPVLSAAAVGTRAEGIRFGEATRDAIAAGLTWIHGELSRPEPSAGLCSFSGHGLMSPGLVLCPADFDGSAGSLVPIAQARDGLGDGKAAHELTVLLDCCHAQAHADSTHDVPARLAALAPGLGGGGGEIPERLLAACRTDQTSVSSRFGGVMQGAFTWAATAAMGQWKATKEDGVARLDLSYGELRDRTQALLSALSFEQETVLSGPPGVARLPFLHPGRRGAAGEATDSPDAPRPRRQLTPPGWLGSQATLGTTATRATGSSPSFGTLCITDDTPIAIGGHPSRNGTEYWYLDATMVAQLADIVQLAFDVTLPLAPGRDYQPPTTYASVAPVLFNTTTFWNPTTRWNLPGSGQTSFVFEGAQGAATVYMQILRQGADQIAQIYWYQQAQAGLARPVTLDPVSISGGTYQAKPSTFTLPAPSAGHGWYVSDATSIGQFAVQCKVSSDAYLGVATGTPIAGTKAYLSSTPTPWLFEPSTAGSHHRVHPPGLEPGPGPPGSRQERRRPHPGQLQRDRREPEVDLEPQRLLWPPHQRQRHVPGGRGRAREAGPLRHWHLEQRPRGLGQGPVEARVARAHG